jgi:nitrous oxide reductase accessory protein NosL
MLVAKFPNWVAVIVYADGSYQFFDGPKDMFRFRHREESQALEKAEIWVTDYYTTRPLKARDAVYVLGSDVFGPMGAELVPFESRELAEDFRADHGGDTPLDFDQVDDAVLRSLD